MANSETSFRDRQAKAQLLVDTVTTFSPAFVPADSSVTIANVTALIGQCDVANSTVETHVGSYTTSATRRVVLLKQMRAAVTQALAYIKSNSAWGPYYKAAKMAADKVRGVTPPLKVEPPVVPQPEGEPVVGDVQRNRGRQAFTEMSAHFGAFVNAVNACSGYAPPSDAISVATLSGLLSDFRDLNEAISLLDGVLTSARQVRWSLYFGAGGLHVRFMAMKTAVKGQYGPNSSQFMAIRTVRW